MQPACYSDVHILAGFYIAICSILQGSCMDNNVFLAAYLAGVL